MPPNSGREFREQLRHDLRDALASRSREATSALRTMIAAIDNAEAVPTDAVAPQSPGGPIAYATQGVGSSEAPRRVLELTDVHGILDDLIVEFDTAAEQYRSLRQHEAAEGLQRQADVVRSYRRTDPSV